MAGTSEPTVPEAAVEAARAAMRAHSNYYVPPSVARAALTAAEPLMHEGCQQPELVTRQRMSALLPECERSWDENATLRAEVEQLRAELGRAVAQIRLFRRTCDPREELVPVTAIEIGETDA